MNDVGWVVLNSIPNILTTVIIFLAGVGVSAIKGFYKDRKAMENGVQALLRHDILVISKSAMQNKHISFTDKEDLTHMYEAYTGLGGNGTIMRMMPLLDKLPVQADVEDVGE